MASYRNVKRPSATDSDDEGVVYSNERQRLQYKVRHLCNRQIKDACKKKEKLEMLRMKPTRNASYMWKVEWKTYDDTGLFRDVDVLSDLSIPQCYDFINALQTGGIVLLAYSPKHPADAEKATHLRIAYGYTQSRPVPTNVPRIPTNAPRTTITRQDTPDHGMYIPGHRHENGATRLRARPPPADMRPVRIPAQQQLARLLTNMSEDHPNAITATIGVILNDVDKLAGRQEVTERSITNFRDGQGSLIRVTDRLEAGHNETVRRHAETTNVVNVLRDQSRSKRARGRQRDVRINECEAQIRHKNLESARDRARICELENQVAVLKRAVSTHDNSISTLKVEGEGIEKRTTSLEVAKTETCERSIQLELEVATMRARMSAFEAHKKEESKYLATLENDIAEIKEKILSIAIDRIEKENRLSELELDREKKKDQISALETTNIGQESQIRELKHAREAHDARISILREELAEAKKEISTLVNKLAEVEAERSRVQDLIAVLNQQSMSLQDQVDRIGRFLNELHSGY